MTTALHSFPHPPEWAAEVHFLTRMSRRYGYGVWPRGRTHLDDWKDGIIMLTAARLPVEPRAIMDWRLLGCGTRKEDRR